MQPVKAWVPIVAVIGSSDEELKVNDANAVQPLKALGPIDVRSVNSKFVRLVHP